MQKNILYIELKTGYNDDSTAWVGLVDYSKTGRTAYFNGKAFKRGHGTNGNYFDIETGDEYWISGIKNDGSNRHWAGSGKIRIEKQAIEEYLQLTNNKILDKKKFIVIENCQKTDKHKFEEIENELL